MYTAMLTVENIFGADHDVWSVNVEEEYHEEVADAVHELTGRARPGGRHRRSGPRGSRPVPRCTSRASTRSGSSA